MKLTPGIVNISGMELPQQGTPGVNVIKYFFFVTGAPAK
jgi:hypothetical protein